MSLFFKSIQTCGALLDKVRAVFGHVCRKVLGGESVVTEVFTSKSVEMGGAASERISTACETETLRTDAASAPKTVGLDIAAPVSPFVGLTTPENQMEAAPVCSMVFSGPVCRVEVSFGYLPPAKGISSLLRALEPA